MIIILCLLIDILLCIIKSNLIIKTISEQRKLSNYLFWSIASFKNSFLKWFIGKNIRITLFSSLVRSLQWSYNQSLNSSNKFKTYYYTSHTYYHNDHEISLQFHYTMIYHFTVQIVSIVLEFLYNKFSESSFISR